MSPAHDPDSGCHETESGPAERRAAGLAHASALLMFFLPLGNVLGPLLFYFAYRNKSEFVTSHALQAAAYQCGVSVLAWGLLVLGATLGFGPGPHLASMMLSLGPSAWAFVRALLGRSSALPLGWLLARLSSSPL